MTFDGPRIGEDRLGERAGLTLIGSPWSSRLLDRAVGAAHPDDTADRAGQTGEAEREHGGSAAVDADRGGLFGGKSGDHLGDLLLHGVVRAQISGGVGADGASSGEERSVLAGAVEIQGRARVGVLVSLCPCAFLQFAAEGSVGGMGGRALQVEYAQPCGLQHRFDDLDVPGFGLVRGGGQGRRRSVELRPEAHRGDRLQRFETRACEHCSIGGAQADQRCSLRVEDDGGADVPGFDEAGALDDGELGGLCGGESREGHALKPTTL